VLEPLIIQEAEALIAAIHRDSGEAQRNYDEFRLFTELRPRSCIGVRQMVANVVALSNCEVLIAAPQQGDGYREV
jgi:hypothetical protein